MYIWDNIHKNNLNAQQRTTYLILGDEDLNQSTEISQDYK